jgi:hypothetical protein
VVTSAPLIRLHRPLHRRQINFQHEQVMGLGAHHLVDDRASFIHAFGPRLHDVVTAEFAERGITGHTGEVATEVKSDEVRYADGTTRRFWRTDAVGTRDQWRSVPR